MSYEKLIRWNSDGASVMLGIRNSTSVVSRLKEMQPNLYVRHYVFHISYLMVTDVVKWGISFDGSTTVLNVWMNLGLFKIGWK